MDAIHECLQNQALYFWCAAALTGALVYWQKPRI